MENIFEIDRVEDLAVHFLCVKPGTHKYTIGLYDVESLQPIYVERDFAMSFNWYYYIEPGLSSKYLRNVVLVVEDSSGERQEAVVQFSKGPARYPVVNGRKKIFHHNNRPSFYTIAEVFYERLYDKDYVRVEKDDVVLDIGANLGMFSAYAQNFNPSRVVSVEPGPEEYHCLVANTNNFKNVETVNCAVSDKTRKVKFSLVREGVSHHITESTTDHQTKDFVFDTIDVDAIGINDLIQKSKLDRIDYLKIDCEGEELIIFKELDKEYLRNHVRKIAVEYHTIDIKHSLIDIIVNQEFNLENVEALDENSQVGMLYFYNKNFF